MKFEQIPLSYGALTADPAYALPLAVAAGLVVILALSMRREFLTFVIAAGVIGALLAA